jgi:transcriptional regulator with PAS, ATPase and Fis domain
LNSIAVKSKSLHGALSLNSEDRQRTAVSEGRQSHRVDAAIADTIGPTMFKGPQHLQTTASQSTLDMPGDLGDALDKMIGKSAAMLHLKQQIVKVAPLDVPVLLTGESGTGKDLAALAMHRLSARRDASMVVVNAAAMPATLVESELFGYEGGSFTGAERTGRRGKVEQADLGTLFFDEIGDMPADVQVKLLRVMQDGSFQRVGGQEPRCSNFRLISASNRDFEAMIEAGTFRLDLFYRIGVVTLRLPALQERLEDIPLLGQRALVEFARKHGRRQKSLSEEAVAFLMRQRWPGNVRQLMHVVKRAAIFSDSDVIHPADFGLVHNRRPNFAPAEISEAKEEEVKNAVCGCTQMSSAVELVEKILIRQALARCRGNKLRAASELGISRSYLYKCLKKIKSE